MLTGHVALKNISAVHIFRFAEHLLQNGSALLILTARVVRITRKVTVITGEQVELLMHLPRITYSVTLQDCEDLAYSALGKPLDMNGIRVGAYATRFAVVSLWRPCDERGRNATDNGSTGDIVNLEWNLPNLGSREKIGPFQGASEIQNLTDSPGL